MLVVLHKSIYPLFFNSFLLSPFSTQINKMAMVMILRAANKHLFSCPPSQKILSSCGSCGGRLQLPSATVPLLNLIRPFFAYFRVSFNTVDEDRLLQVGPDRLCAEWLLKNGATVSFVNGSPINDYNMLGPSRRQNSHISSVDATDSSIMDIGFEHFKGCSQVRLVNLTRCKHIENEALEKLAKYLPTSLEQLTIVDCFNITGAGLHHLTALTALKHLVVSGVPYAKDLDGVKRELDTKLPHTKIEIGD